MPAPRATADTTPDRARAALPEALDDAAAMYGTCHPTLVLRTVLMVEVAVGIAALVAAPDWPQALALMGLTMSAGLLGSLLWLVFVCALRKQIVRMGSEARVILLLGLAAVMAPLACLPLVAFGLMEWQGPRALGLPLAGAALAAPMVAWLEVRARSRRPADASARLAELQSRIRPHFLFNALNSALALVQVEPARAEGLLEDLAELFRAALAAPGASVSLAEELALARRYLAIEQVRFGERLRVAWEIDDAAGSARLPPLLLQPLVENAVRHGIEPAAEGGVVRVRCSVRRGQVEIAVDNTLAETGRSAPGNGIALANVRERLRLMHDLAAQFDARRLDGWYRVRIVLPLEPLQ